MIPNSSLNQKNNGSWRGNLGSIPSPTMVTWLVDGNNLSCSRKVPNERETILKELLEIASLRDVGSWDACRRETDEDPRNDGSETPLVSSVVVVFDGNEDETSDATFVEDDRWFEWTVTDGSNRSKDRADDWIVDKAIPSLQKVIDERVSKGMGTGRVHLVSADRELQKRVGATRIMNGGSFVHPPKFWKDYLPVLQDQQRRERQEREEGA
jgi:hypothetical protein